MNNIFVLLLSLCISSANCFIPAKLMSEVINELDSSFSIDIGKVDTTYVHEEILKRGLIRSVTKFFYDQPGGSSKIDLRKADYEYQDLLNLYYDYYNVTFCSVKLQNVLKIDLQPFVAIVDFDKLTKDLPYAHFDAERFLKSNDRVINFTSNIFKNLQNKNYQEAKELTGQVLHTIQDFYSHSNWVEMGNTNINKLIGTENFSSMAIVDANQNITCFNNCNKTEISCGAFVELVIALLELLNIKQTKLKCPLTFYKCSSNIADLTNLISGYYTGQFLDDDEHTPVLKPNNSNSMKCSHGGILDKSAFLPAEGGINKDSAFYLFSPHADLHTKAAFLAINHTEYLFNQIRSKIGDSEFANFLSLTYNETYLKSINNTQSCKMSITRPSLIIECLFLTSFLVFQFFL